MSRVVWQSCLWELGFGLEDPGHHFLIVIQDTVKRVKRGRGYIHQLFNLMSWYIHRNSELILALGLWPWKTKRFSNKVHKLNEVRFGYFVIEETWGIASCCRNQEESRQQLSDWINVKTISQWQEHGSGRGAHLSRLAGRGHHAVDCIRHLLMTVDTSAPASWTVTTGLGRFAS